MQSIGRITVSLSFVFLIIVRASAQDLCGVLHTVSGSTAEYTYHDGSFRSVQLPLDVRFEISCHDSALDAVINSPIIGVDERGNEIFPTGLSYPLSVSALYDSALDYYGVLLDTQYHFQWVFVNTNEGTIWSGTVGWTGGRFEQTDIVNIRLLPVPECASWTLLALGSLTMFVFGRPTSTGNDS